MNIYLYGGAIYDLNNNKKPKDFDLIIETKESAENWTKAFLIKNNFKIYSWNSFGGLKLTTPNNLIVDIAIVKDINEHYFEFLEFNADDIFYNIKTKELKHFEKTYKDYEENGKIIRLGKEHPVKKYRSKERFNKLTKYNFKKIDISKIKIPEEIINLFKNKEDI